MVRAAQKGEGASSPEVAQVAASIKKKDAKDFASTKHKGLPMKKEEFINEEDYDRMKDRRMERGGVGGNNRYDRPPAKKLSNAELGIKPGKTQLQKDSEKKHGKGASALDIVKAQIRAKHGDKAIMDTKKKANEGYAPGDVDQKVGAVTAIPKKEQDDARARILAKTKAKREARLKEAAMVNEMPYQVYGSPDGKKEKKIGKPVKSRKYAADRASELEDTHKKTGGKYRSAYTEETINERGDFWHPDPEKDRKLGGPGANQRAREDRAAASKPKEDPKKLRPGESYMDYAKRQKSSKMKREAVEGKSFKEFLEEGNRTGRMMQKSKSQVTGHISADRGDDEKKNREGRKTLEKDLKKHGIGHKKGVGEYKYGSGETGREVSYQTSKPDKMSKRRFGKVMRRLGRKHGQESVITKDKEKSAKLHYTEKGSKAKSDSIGKSKAGKHPEGYGETSGTKVRGGKLPKKTNKGAYHYG
ncbi:hypothetical protein BOW92_gp145 [Synechococcus phage S-WAM1]|uniref:Uncharacterized protein n=1 Tax=Synechococcus phage S-WAM1 TaxID=1815521 RepID=A0A1D8KSE5_9CAUD|nr:hypothetical protein BOW92_gp145 [Synechococcus phage S-WAM1]AOV61572.1 hypothetical protein P090810_099 [Synechococcus phage S-WAM1]